MPGTRRGGSRPVQLCLFGQNRLRPAPAANPEQDRRRGLMKALRDILDKVHPHFARGGRLERLYPLYEAADSFLYTPGQVTITAPHVRDAMDLKRVMITVVFALLPCFFMAMWNTGYQANLAMQAAGGSVEGWRGTLLALLGFTGNPGSLVDNLLLGAAWFVPIYLVSNIVGGLWEALFASI